MDAQWFQYKHRIHNKVFYQSIFIFQTLTHNNSQSYYAIKGNMIQLCIKSHPNFFDSFYNEIDTGIWLKLILLYNTDRLLSLMI